MTEAIVRVGRGADGADLELDLCDPYHYVIQGMTRSGKSNFMYGLLVEASRHEHLLVAGCDPTGILLAPFAQGPKPELRFAGGRDLQRALSVLDALVAEMDGRIRDLLARQSDNLETFSAAVPLIVVVMEEYPGLLAAAEALDTAEGARGAARISSALALNVQRLVQESAKVGFRVMILAQRAEASVLGSAVRSNLATRVTLRVDNADSVRMLHPFATPATVAAVAAFEPGQGIIDRPGRALTVFRADHLTYDRYIAFVLSRFNPEVATSRENVVRDAATMGDKND